MSALAQHLSPLMTADAFMVWPGDGTPGKQILVNGVIRARAPTTITHGLLQATLARLIGNHLKHAGRGCRVVTEAAMRPRFNARINVRIPDLAVTSTPSRADERELLDPVLLIEVLSPSNSEDTYNSIALCATIPSVREVLVVDSDRVYVEAWTKGADGAWPVEPRVYERGDVLALDSIVMTLAVDDVYADTRLAIA